MTKAEFISLLQDRLSNLTRDDARERLAFYSEMIDDRMEEGLSEEEAVGAVGSVDEIASQILADVSYPAEKEKSVPKKGLGAGNILLLVLGSPIWLCLLIAAFAVILSLYASIWSLIVTFWAVFGSLVGCSFGAIAAGVVFAFTGNVLAGTAMIAAGIFLAGLSIFAFFGCEAGTKGVLLLTKKLWYWVKSFFEKKEEV